MLNPQSCERPLAFHLAKKMPYRGQTEDNQQTIDSNGSLQLTGGPDVSSDVIYDF